ncbi:MAG: MiaB/RimO family radical SAM methylthiotransferase [Caldisericia bacterium]|nr:MiaB/RimO family radical SAM methylthiotransferase [Caldisericia bacterium]MDD4613960.1 MiaB/RimO family radical SAM methylthiotransferase [Caldisericia bacterium]
MIKKLFVKTYGCKVNQYNTQVILQSLHHLYDVVSVVETADIVVINACVVTEKAERECISYLRKVHKNPHTKLFITGCLGPSIQEYAVKNQIPRGTLEEIITLLQNESRFIEIPKRRPIQQLHHFGDRTRAFIKIQSGCNQFCSYCIVPYVRGPVVSRTKQDIFLEIQSLLGAGYKELVLTGTQVGLYQDPTCSSYQFYELLEDICQTFSDDLYRLRISSIGMRFVTQTFCDLIERYPILCNHLHISLQSGSNSVLQRMNRHYTIEEYYQVVTMLRSQLSDFQVSTDVIVGFPGETEEEFEDTLSWIRRIQFSKIHIFPYSARSGTSAEKLPHHIPFALKKERRDRLLAIENTIRYNIHENCIGASVKILLEGNNTGLTRNYIRVRLQDLDCAARVGHLYDVNGTKADVNFLYAKLKG